MQKKKSYIRAALYLITAVLFLAAFATNNVSSMRYVSLFCAIIFGSLGVMVLLKKRGSA